MNSFAILVIVLYFQNLSFGSILLPVQQNRRAQPPFLKTDRGGKTTFHGPGQLVIYFILNMKKLPFSPTKLTSNLLKNTLEVLEGFGLKIKKILY